MPVAGIWASSAASDQSFGPGDISAATNGCMADCRPTSRAIRWPRTQHCAVPIRRENIGNDARWNQGIGGCELQMATALRSEQNRTTDEAVLIRPDEWFEMLTCG